jgi:hypothetical protein
LKEEVFVLRYKSLLTAVFLSLSMGQPCLSAHSSFKLERLEDVASVKKLCSRENLDNGELQIFSFEIGKELKFFVLAVKPFQLYSPCPVVLSPTRSTSQALDETGAVVAMNAGYFNLSDGQSAGYILKDGNVLADPRENKALTRNLKLKPFLESIFNRSELRALEFGGKRVLQIARHKEKLPGKARLLWSVQGGPALLPVLFSETEAFLRKNADGSLTDSIGVLRPAARSAIGLTKEGLLLLVSVAGNKQDEFSQGLDLKSLAQLLRRLGATQALNLDGGTSTTLVVKTGLLGKEAAGKENMVIVGREPQTKVASVLLLREDKGQK